MSKLKRLIEGVKSGGFDYLLYAVTSYFPEWLFRYYHTYLIETDDIKLITRQYKDYRVRFATEDDAGNMGHVESTKEKALHRFKRGDTCVLVLKGERIVAIGWAATGRLYNRFAGSIVDTGDKGFFLYGIYIIPEERLKGFLAVCFQKQIEHYNKIGRTHICGVTEVLNKNSVKTHLRMGFQITGETYYLAVLGISICYYKKWPVKTNKLHIFFKRPPENLEWV